MKLEPGGGGDIKRTKPDQQKADRVTEASKSTAPAVQQPIKPKYDFYTLLPESEVIVPPEADGEPGAVYDIRSGAPGNGRDGSPYAEW